MNGIMTGFVVVAALASVAALLVWWRGRPVAAAALTVLAVLAATPSTLLLPDGVIVAGLVVTAGTVAFLVWPRRDQGSAAGPEADAGAAAETDREPERGGRRDVTRGGGERS